MQRLMVLLMFVTSFTVILSQKVEYSGYGATGIRFYDRNILNGVNQETYYQGKIQAEIKYSKELEAQIDLRGNSIDNSIELREFSVKFEFLDKLKIKVGNVKRPFGYEYLINREKLLTIERSLIQDRISEAGFGTRSVSLLLYHKYKKSDKDFPYTYYFSFFKDNSQVTGTATHLRYHLNKALSVGGNYMFQAYGGETSFSVHGFAFDVGYDDGDFVINAEVTDADDPIEGKIKKLAGIDDDVQMFGAKLLGAYKFDIDGKVVKDIEPVLLTGIFYPDTDIQDTHIIQMVVGFNLYFDKKIRARLNGDLRLTKNQFNEDYTTKESRGVFELQVRF